MGEQLDYTTLKWVKDEIQESLNQTQQALEAYIEDPSDTTQIRFCAAYLHQVYGTLQMVEIYGASLLAEEMEKVANALLNDQVANKEDAFDVLIRAIIQLPAYLEGLERGQADMPVVLTPLLNDLRAARGEPLLSESAFFSPDINVAPPERRQVPGKEYPELPVYARKLRPIYQVGLLGWFRDDDVAGSLKKLAAVLRELQNASKSETTQRLWWVAGGIAEALLDEGLDVSVSVKLLMGQVDREIKRLIDNGEDAFVMETPSELLKNCLYYVGSATSGGPRVSAVKQAFNLDALLPYSGAVDQAMDDLKGSTADIMENVSSVIKEDLLQVKDQLDIFVRSSDRNVASLSPLAETLSRTADTLAMLNLADLRKVIQKQAANIKDVVASENDPDENVLMEVASALLYVESSLDTLQESEREHSEEEAPDLAVHVEDTDEGNVVLLPKSEQIQITNLVIKEAREVLAGVKEAFNTFALEPEKIDSIADVPAKLSQIKGALAVMDSQKAADLLGAASAYINNEVLSNKENPDVSKLDVLADAITSIEYYLEAIGEGVGQPESVLAVAEISVEQLGYPLGGEYEVTSPEATEALDTVEEAESEGEIEFDFSDEPELVAEEETLEEPAEAIAEAEEGMAAEPAASVDVASAIDSEAPDEEYLEEDIDDEILEIFVEEADEVLGTMTDCLHAWRANVDDQKSLETLRRSYHTLKGSGRLAGAMVLGEFAWAMENMLNRVMEGKLEASPGMFSLLEQSEITVNKLLDYLKGKADQRPPVKRLSDLAYALADGEQLSIADVAPAGGSAEPSLTVIENVETAAEEIAPEVDESAALGEFSEDSAAAESNDMDFEFDTVETTEFELSDAESAEDSDVIEFEAEPDDESVELDITGESDSQVADAEPAIDPVLAQVFRKETITHLAALNEFISEYGESDSAPVDDNLHRALHTLHGSARMAGVEAIAELSEPMDRLVRTLHERDGTLDAGGISLLKEFTEAVEAAADNIGEEGSVAKDHAELLEKIAGLHEQALKIPLPQKAEEQLSTGFNDIEVDDELIGIFIEETSDILNNSDEVMQRWKADVTNLDVIGELQRALHTIKGGARLAGLKPVGDLTHELESVLESVTDGHNEVAEGLPAVIQAGLDYLVSSLEAIKEGGNVEPADNVISQIQALQSAETSSDEPESEIEASFDEVSANEPVESPEETQAGDVVAEELSAELPPTEVIDIEEPLFDESVNEIEEDLTADLPPTEVIELEEPLFEASANLEESDGLEPVVAEEEDEFEQLETMEPMQVKPADEPPAEVPAAAVDYDEDLLEVFLEEAEEIQEETERVLYDWSREVDNLDHVAELQRSLHTLKGGARMANVTAVGDLAHAMESLLERITDGRTAPEAGHSALIQSCHDWLVRALEEAKNLQPIVPATDLVTRLEAAINGEAYEAGAKPAAEPEEPASAEPEEILAEGIPATQPEPLPESETEELAEVISFKDKIEAKPKEEKAAVGGEEQIRVRADLLNNLVNYSGEINIYNSRIAQQLGATRFNLTELAQTVARLREQLRKFEIETEAQIIFRHETTADEDNVDFDPLEMDRFSTMQQLSRGMVESLGDLTSIQNLLENQSSETDVLLLQQQRVTSELQEGLMRTRMVAFSSVLPRLRRIVRQTCSEIGKQAELHVKGAEGELDRTQLNRLVPALEHILRNAIDHGLEMPDEREALGKTPAGNINITFSHEGSEVVLTIKDDGRGINIDALRNKAIEKGLMMADADLADTEIMEFMLEAGFSTAEKVTQISGRGVGMDVVNNEIKQLGGSLHINSKSGKGSTFRMHLPLTVLVNQALMVQTGDATYAIQLPNIEHVVRLGREELEPLVNNESATMEYAGNTYQYLNLGTVLHGAAPQLPEKRQRVPLMLIRSADHRIALHVDNLIGRQEIVIKSVGPQLSSVGVLSGATILPDGEVALILDVGNLVRSALAQQHGKAEPLLPTQEAEEDAERVITVMVVDDSITVRKVTERLLKRYEYNIITAKDGVDALTVLLEQIPDVMLLDVEMPRMDGFELATTMRNDPRLKDIPIIMITSRTGDKHRQRALDIGVNMYMGKPYQEHDLIENICTLTGTTRD
ncbi:Hpt domain-containing protein [Kaarinaea lacus]